MKAGIAIEPWKLEIFRRHLTGAGFAFNEAGKMSESVMLLTLETGEALKPFLQSTILEALAECTRVGPPNQ